MCNCNRSLFCASIHGKAHLIWWSNSAHTAALFLCEKHIRRAISKSCNWRSSESYFFDELFVGTNAQRCAVLLISRQQVLSYHITVRTGHHAHTHRCYAFGERRYHNSYRKFSFIWLLWIAKKNGPVAATDSHARRTLLFDLNAKIILFLSCSVSTSTTFCRHFRSFDLTTIPTLFVSLFIIVGNMRYDISAHEVTD